ncbi:MAG: hypothetical protein ACRBDI_03615 [Alphaproteobacteria bacterium]
MSTALSEQLDGFIRFCVPYALIFVFFTLNMVSFSAPLSTKIEAPLIVMVVYYWSVYRPTLIPPVLVFFIGIYFDLLASMPLGLSAFILLVLRQAITEQRVFLIGQPFVMIWLGFTVTMVISLMIQWCLFGFINLHWTPFTPVILMMVSGALIFPMVFLVLNLSHKVLPTLRDQYSAVK